MNFTNEALDYLVGYGCDTDCTNCNCYINGRHIKCPKKTILRLIKSNNHNNDYGQHAVIEFDNSTHYYYMLDDEIEFVIDIDNDTHEWNIRSHAYWDIGPLVSDLQEDREDLTFVYLNLDYAGYLINEFMNDISKTAVSKVGAYVLDTMRKEGE